jgi:hypothetical protein
MSRPSKHFGKPATAVFMPLRGVLATAKFSDMLENPQLLTQLRPKNRSHTLSSTTKNVMIRSQKMLLAWECYGQKHLCEAIVSSLPILGVCHQLSLSFMELKFKSYRICTYWKIYEKHSEKEAQMVFPLTSFTGQDLMSAKTSRTHWNIIYCHVTVLHT